jgi:hypothetical protein
MDEGLDVNEVDALGHTPLHVAAGSEEPNSGCLCECDFLGLVSYTAACACLCCAPPAMQARTHTLTMSSQVLHVCVCLSVCLCMCVCITAVYSSHTGAVVALLCERKAAVHLRALLSGETALHRAANEGKSDAVAALLKEMTAPEMPHVRHWH